MFDLFGHATPVRYVILTVHHSMMMVMVIIFQAPLHPEGDLPTRATAQEEGQQRQHSAQDILPHQGHPVPGP